MATCSFIPSRGAAQYDIAYCVHKRHWNEGFATEMAQGMITYAKRQGAGKTTIAINKDNAASNKIARKLGCMVVGERTYQKRGTSRTLTDYMYELIITP